MPYTQYLKSLQQTLFLMMKSCNFLSEIRTKRTINITRKQNLKDTNIKNILKKKQPEGIHLMQDR